MPRELKTPPRLIASDPRHGSQGRPGINIRTKRANVHARRLRGKTRACKARAGQEAHVARPLAPSHLRGADGSARNASRPMTPPHGHLGLVCARAHARRLTGKTRACTARAGLEAHFARFLAPSLNGGAGGSARMIGAAQ